MLSAFDLEHDFELSKCASSFSLKTLNKQLYSLHFWKSFNKYYRNDKKLPRNLDGLWLRCLILLITISQLWSRSLDDYSDTLQYNH